MMLAWHNNSHRIVLKEAFDKSIRKSLWVCVCSQISPANYVGMTRTFLVRGMVLALYTKLYRKVFLCKKRK